MLKPESAPAQINTSLINDEIREKCGVAGVYMPEGYAVQATYLAIEAMQHRGQDGAGISFIEQGPQNTTALVIKKELGRVASGFKDGMSLSHITKPQFATGHVRYGTTEAEDEYDALHPLRFTARNKDYSVAHNGQMDMDELSRVALEHGIEPVGTDTDLFTKILAVNVEEHLHLEPALHRFLPQLKGAFNLSILSDEGIYAVTDSHRMRPYVLGKHKSGGVMAASEVGGLKAADFSFTKEIPEATYVVINEDGVREETWGKKNKKRCIFEYTYVSKPDNIIDGITVGDYRFVAGEMLANKETVEANMVVPVLGSARSYARGFEFGSHIPYVEALQKNPNRKNPKSDRTFIAKTQEDREAAVRDKFIVDADAVKDKSVVLVDDSLVRGTTTRIIIEMLREAGAAEVHVRIGSEIYADICKYGVNVKSKDELLSQGNSVEDMARLIGADSLQFLPRKEMHEAAQTTEDEVCDGCMKDGNYPDMDQPDSDDAVLVTVAS